MSQIAVRVWRRCSSLDCSYNFFFAVFAALLLKSQQAFVFAAGAAAACDDDEPTRSVTERKPLRAR